METMHEPMTRVSASNHRMAAESPLDRSQERVEGGARAAAPAPVEVCDAIVIGGGPGGSTVATLLAREGLDVRVFEKKTFPRFHIGESLLPASLPILEELGVHQQVKKMAMLKPGGKWYYDHRPMLSNFSEGPAHTSFAQRPYAYMVKRDEFDDLLLKHSAACGARVCFEHSVTDIVREGERVVGVVVKDKDQNVRTVRAGMVFDCSGHGAVISKRLGIRKENRLRRMAIFGHYHTQPLNEDLKKGWFVGQMIRDGWIWMIPLKPNLISIGVVCGLERYQKANQSPREFLEHYIRSVPVVKAGITPEPQLEGEIQVYGNLGYTTTRAQGPGWVLVGDAAFFIDPCYSSGVHLALSSAREAALLFLEQRRTGQCPNMLFERYEKTLRRDEKLVLRFVEAFYMASRNKFLRWFIPASNNSRMNRAFVRITGGDFATRPNLINMLYYSSKILSTLIPLPVRE